MAPNILLLIMFRVVQGVGGGMLMPLSFVILTREAGPQRLGRLMAIGGIPMLLGPIGGPILGGWLIGAYGWKWIFLINLPIGLISHRPGGNHLSRKIAGRRRKPSTSSACCCCSPAWRFSSSACRPSRPRHASPIPTCWYRRSLGLALIAAFVVHACYRTEHPLIDLRLFQNRVVTQANVTMLVFGARFFGTGLLVPSYFQLVHAQDADAVRRCYMLPQSESGP